MRNECNKYEKQGKIGGIWRKNYEKRCFRNHFSLPILLVFYHLWLINENMRNEIAKSFLVGWIQLVYTKWKREILTLTFYFSFYSWQRRKLSYLCDTLHINQAGNLPRFRGRHFYACPDASYGGFVPPCGVLMHPLPGWWRVTGKAEPLLFHRKSSPTTLFIIILWKQNKLPFNQRWEAW